MIHFSTEDDMARALCNEKSYHIIRPVSLNYEDLLAIKFVNEKEENTNIPRWQVNNVRCFIGYV